MKSYGTLQESISQPADSVQTMLLAAATPQNMDWPGAPAAAGAGGMHIVRFTGQSSAGAAIGFIVNLQSSNAAALSSGSSVTTGSTAGSPGNNIAVNGSRVFWIPPYSTGWSVSAPTSGYVQAEVWKRN